MIILSHRGYWLTEHEKNTKEAFERSFKLGFGTETDIRDLNGKLVISHDIPHIQDANIFVEDFFDIYKKHNKNLPLALNIKSDGLVQELVSLLRKYEIHNYFVFDMSVPDGLSYIRQNANVFTRQSEYELEPSYYSESMGVWLDEFKHHWIDSKTITNHLNRGKKVCIVSPELHKRNYFDEWKDYKDIDSKILVNGELMICTDKPIEAREYFNEKN
ncbi:PI-PLC domain-containing protein [Pedobacter namyangjuensis]|uniref:hypothetical protein n=1 Tax=Pedobacter namyangjuensis TaxID=600626 RepID=UPI000DE3093D|nr:hypothetical protein [Pedobacter namyangjuensis]